MDYNGNSHNVQQHSTEYIKQIFRGGVGVGLPPSIFYILRLRIVTSVSGNLSLMKAVAFQQK